MIEVSGITKTYRSRGTIVKALDGLDFSAARGEVFGIIGPDGAGKTSLFRILTTLLTPDAGSARVNGLDTVKDYRAIRQVVGYMPGRFSLYQDLSVEENLRFFAAIFGVSIEANYSLIDDIYRQLEPFRTRKAGQLSGGMKQKLALCCALIHQPLVLFLDEPTTGVDAVSRKEFWEMLHRLKGKGITILVSTSYMDEAGLCDRVALLQNGRLLSVDTPAQIRRNFGKPLWAVKARETFRLLPALKAAAAVDSCYPFGQYYHVVLQPDKGRDELEALLREGDFTEVDIHPAEPGIEDCFIALMK
ncbi:MAG TPA: ABC transporter ATP-binding protein [Puia sp.]|jgi:ABC-type multidrug transport system ATPase subunit|uniref:ABC transporter ATP-binding protein n=1 Tax=Puia sp. TaxID=2045100 RepID=UPI002CE1713C|nr:ABC transporter ATP-binding protein [Puia sp.]HVU98009.1 ABC transporter ATP-binding protein [Puia sp.]